MDSPKGEFDEAKHTIPPKICGKVKMSDESPLMTFEMMFLKDGRGLAVRIERLTPVIFETREILKLAISALEVRQVRMAEKQDEEKGMAM